MDRAKYESQKAFAGEKKPSMQRRCVDNDYTARRMYMITMTTEGRKPLFGKVVGHSETVEPSAENPAYDGATGIASMTNDESHKTGDISDLQGRRVDTPTHGLYIVNGKKVWVK